MRKPASWTHLRSVTGSRHAVRPGARAEGEGEGEMGEGRRLRTPNGGCFVGQLGPCQPRRQAACGRERCHRRQYLSKTPRRGEGSLRRCGEEPGGCDVVVVMMLEKGGNAADARNNLDLRWEPNRSSQLLSFADRDTPLQKLRVRCKYSVSSIPIYFCTRRGTKYFYPIYLSSPLVSTHRTVADHLSVGVSCQ